MPAIPIIAGVATLAGMGVSAYSTIASGDSSRRAANYNAGMERMKAVDALQRGSIEAAARQDNARKIASAQREGVAMSGVATDYGTPLDLLSETAGFGKLDALRTVNNAQREAWGMNAQGTLDKFQGRAAGRAGILNATGTLLGSASNAVYGAYKDGMFD